MLFWHVGGAIAVIRYTFRDERMDLRLVIVGVLLPTLIDAPIGIIGWDRFESLRLVAHSLVFAASLMTAILLTTRRGRPRKKWMPLAVGVLLHLVLDAMWREPETLWWPFFGWAFTSTGLDTAGDYIRAVAGDWRTWALESIGLAYLIVLWRRSRLGDPERRATFISTGRVDAHIGRR